MRRLLAVAGLWVIVAAGCSSPADDEARSDEDAPSSTSTTSQTTTTPVEESGADDGDEGATPDGLLLRGPELAERLAELEGQLALGNGPAVAVARPDGEALQVIGVEGETAAQPTWSRDGLSLAWSSVSAARQAVLVQSFDDDGQPDGDPAISAADGFPVFYLQWSGDDQRLGFLRSAPEPGQVEFGFVEPGRPVEPVAQDTPFFVTWSPGSGQVLAHVGQRTVELHDPAAPADGPREVLAQGDDYSAPVWLDDERALVVADDSLAVLTIDDGAVEPLEPADGPIRFVLSPDRRRVAYRLLNAPGDGPITASLTAATTTTTTPEATSTTADPSDARPTDDGGLVVLDLETGQRQVLADDSVVAWEWSPDGTRLAWLSLQTQARLIGRWNFWSVDGSDLTVNRTPDFGLSRTYAEIYLPFFAQYAQSITGWAPDSSAYAFAGNVAGDRGVHVQLLDDLAEAVQVSGGDFVTWGPGPTPSPGAGASAA